MKRIFLVKLMVVVLAIAIFILSGCGRGGRTGGDNQDQAAPIGTAEGLPDIPYGETFTVFTPFASLSRIQASADNFQNTMAARGVNLHFDFIYYTQEDWQQYRDLLFSKFAAGVGPDIFIRDFIWLYPLVEKGLLADIYWLIDQSAMFSRDDFFTNMLDGIAVDGQLFMMPVHFGIDYIGINANVPPSFISRFDTLDRARPSDFVKLYLDLVNEHPEWAYFALIHGLNANQAFMPELTNAVDFTGRAVNIATDPILLENIRAAFRNNNRFDTPPFINWNAPVDYLTVKQERYVFSRVSGIAAGVYGLFEFRDPFFISYVPLADESGRLVNRAHYMEMVVNKNTNPDLALGFMTQFISDTMTAEFIFGQNIPILRRYFERSVDTGFYRTLGHGMTLPPIIDNTNVAIQQAISRMREYSGWCFNTLIVNYLIPAGPAVEMFTEFLQSDMPAYEAIYQMETALTAWLNEERTEITPFEYIPAQEPEEDKHDFPVRTLTIRTCNLHTPVIRQAASAMNAAWRADNRPYTFQVEVEDHNWRDWEGRIARHTRLQTELMAGQGPDMFLFDGHDIHALVASGFLQNIYTLMDACPNTSRDDFFTQALQAFEINNGLYMFPTSFGFEYVGINVNIPMEFLDRFFQKSTISFAEMMELYLDLKYVRGDEFGHLDFNVGTGITWSPTVLQSTMGGFIDFNARISNLTDPRFIEFLELARGVYADWDIPGLSFGHPIETPSSLQQRAREHMFRVQSNFLNPMYAFFTAAAPTFVSQIPLADSYGRLLLNDPGRHFGEPVWSAICITAVADGALAWEFTQHLIYTYANATGRLAMMDDGSPAGWGYNSFATPILRSLFPGAKVHNFERVLNGWFRGQPGAFLGFDTPESRARQFENAINRIAAYNEQPMGMLAPQIPWGLYIYAFDYFVRGIISAEEAAQRMHNAVSLWLIE